MKKYISFALMMMLSVAACQKQPSGDENPGKIKLSEEKIYFECGQGQSISVKVECDGDWQIENYSEGMKVWLEADALKGSGNASISFKTVEFNPYDEKRMAVLDFVSGKAKSSLVITQLPDPERTIALSEDALAFGGQLSTKNITVYTSKNWSIGSAIPSWLKIDPSEYEGQKTINISTVEVNEEIDPRSCTLEFRIDRVHTASLNISQAPGIELKIDTDLLEFGSQGGESKQMQVNCNSATKEWRIDGFTSEVQEWLSIDILKGTGDKTLTFRTLGKNADLTKTARMKVMIDEKRAIDFTVTQASGLEISVQPESLGFDGNQADTKSVTVTTNTDKYEWTLEGYTSEVREWLSIDIEKAASLSKTVNLSTSGPNTTGTVLTAKLSFKLSEGVEAHLIVSQDKKQAGLKVISWTGNKEVQTITAPAGENYSYFPYTTDSDPSKSPKWTDGPDGALMFTGYFKATRNYIFKMDSAANVGNSYTLELGCSSIEDVHSFYGNLKLHGYSGYRTNGAYVKAPAISGYRLSGVKIICGNAADRANAVTFATDKSISSGTPSTAANVLESKAQLTLGKPTPVNVSFTKTSAGTAYYIFITQDRLITGLTLTYSEVE